MQDFHIDAAHGNEFAADIRKLKACFEVNLCWNKGCFAKSPLNF